MDRPRFYFDAFSPYAYMSAERIDDLIPDADWRPIYAWGLFKLNGRTAWVFTDERESRMREIEQRAEGYGLPPITWPQSLPNVVGLARLATLAKREGRERELGRAVLRAVYAEGADLTDPDELRRLARDCDLDPDRLLAALDDQDVKDELRARTEEANAAGVPGVPTVVAAGEVFWGDDRLEEAARAVAAASR